MDNTLIVEAKDRILNSAIKLFSEKGYDATRVSEIAGAANVNKASYTIILKIKRTSLTSLYIPFWKMLHL